MMGEAADTLAWKEDKGYKELVVTDIARHTHHKNQVSCDGW